MNKLNEYGKRPLQKKVMRLKYRKNISLKEAWNEVVGKPKTTKKSSKSTLNKLSLEKLRKLSKKYKVSIYRKNSKKMIKKSTLINRLLKSKKSKKILKSASRMKKAIKNNFGVNAGIPQFKSLTDQLMSNTQSYRAKRYATLPPSHRSFNLVKPVIVSKGALLPSQAPYGNTSNKFGQYFR
jgi:hypothetical protein